MNSATTLIVITRPDHLRKIGFEYPFPSYVGVSSNLLQDWIRETNPELNRSERYWLFEMIREFDHIERRQPHTIEYRVRQTARDYYGLKGI